MVVILLKKYHIRTHISLVPIASEEQPSTKVMKKKIHIGYILKSADIRTLVSRRNSENSSHTHAYTHAYPKTSGHQRTPRYTQVYPGTPPYTRTHPCTPVQPPFCPLPHPCTPAHTHKSPRTPAHTHTRTQPCSPHTPHTYPLMPADALNLKIHMKLHVNGKTAER